MVKTKDIALARRYVYYTGYTSNCFIMNSDDGAASEHAGWIGSNNNWASLGIDNEASPLNHLLMNTGEAGGQTALYFGAIGEVNDTGGNIDDASSVLMRHVDRCNC